MPSKEAENIVEIRNVYKRYGKTLIYRGLNMTVEKGTIYGLLGPSGCGKTTLLTSLTGYRRFDSGTVSVGLTDRTQLGYMPQEISLIELFSVSEMFQYFGRVNRMKVKDIRDRGKMFLDMMELDSNKFWRRKISDMSGGQQRRISMIVALLHDPILLIFDEPTVGLDPLLSEKLWVYFVVITKEQKKTLIITTHYIEEAGRSDRIGLLRKGVILEELPPKQILAKYNCKSLEDAFLHLSQKQADADTAEHYVGKYCSVKPPIPLKKLYDRRRINALIYKNFCWAKRNIPMMIIMLLLPALLMFLYCEVYSDNLRGILIASVSHEVIPESCLDPKNKSEEIPKCSGDSKYSCQFLRYIKQRTIFEVEEFKTYKSAYKKLKSGKAKAVLEFQQNYSLSLLHRMYNGSKFNESFIREATRVMMKSGRNITEAMVVSISEGGTVTDQVVNDSMVEANVNMADSTIGYKVKRALRDSFLHMLDVIFVDCGWNTKLGRLPIVFMDPPVFGKYPPQFSHTAFSGFVIPFSFFITSYSAGSALNSEKVSGFLERSLVCGVRHTEVMLAHTVFQVVMFFGQDAILIFIIYVIYELPMVGNIFLAVSFITMAHIQGMFYGYILGTWCEKESNITNASVGTAIGLFFSCGMCWPIEGSHWSLYYLLRYNPIGMAAIGYNSVTVRGWGLDNSNVLISWTANILFCFFVMFVYSLVSRIKT